MADIDFKIEFQGFNEGLSPLAHLDSKTYIGNKGQASEMKADIISSPGFITQSPLLVDLVNGTEKGVVDQLIRFILDRPTAANVTYGLGTSKLFRISSDTVDLGSRLSSISPSASPSKSVSLSPSVSKSPSISPSTSPSVSVSPSGSGSKSPSISPSVSPSVSVSPSPSPSTSPSVSISPSKSPSVSPSVSVSPSISPSVSPSTLPSWPQTVTSMIEGESLVRLGTNLYGFYNKTTGGDIFKMPLNTEVIDASWGSTNDSPALQKSLHPVAAKEDIMVFGNGRYAGVYIDGGTLDTQKLDFGEGKRGQVYIYDGSAISNILSDEVGVGDQNIGFLYVLNGIVYVAYDDTSSNGFTIGWLQGRQLKPLRYFSGSLPDHRQKALYKNTIIFNSSTEIMSMGASVEQLPLQISTLADGGHPILGGIASPFGVPMIASSDNGANHRIAKFSGFSTNSNWKSVFVDLTNDRMLGKVHTIIVSTKVLGSGARCDLKLEGNQGIQTKDDDDNLLYESSEFEISGSGKSRHVFISVDMQAVEDIRLVLNYAKGSTERACPIRKVVALGNFVER